MADVVTSAVRVVVVVVLVGGAGGSGSRFAELECFFLILGMLFELCMAEGGFVIHFLSITTVNRCCVEHAFL